MHEYARDRLIAARNEKDAEEFVKFLAEAIEGSDEVLLAYVLGRIDGVATAYLSSNGVSAVLRRLVTDVLNVNEVPQSAYDYEPPAEAPILTEVPDA